MSHGCISWSRLQRVEVRSASHRNGQGQVSTAFLSSEKTLAGFNPLADSSRTLEHEVPRVGTEKKSSMHTLEKQGPKFRSTT